MVAVVTLPMMRENTIFCFIPKKDVHIISLNQTTNDTKFVSASYLIFRSISDDSVNPFFQYSDLSEILLLVNSSRVMESKIRIVTPLLTIVKGAMLSGKSHAYEIPWSISSWVIMTDSLFNSITNKFVPFRLIEYQTSPV